MRPRPEQMTLDEFFCWTPTWTIVDNVTWSLGYLLRPITFRHNENNNTWLSKSPSHSFMNICKVKLVGVLVPPPHQNYCPLDLKDNNENENENLLIIFFKVLQMLNFFCMIVVCWWFNLLQAFFHKFFLVMEGYPHACGDYSQLQEGN